MIIGMIDYDMVAWPRAALPNLELMKISAYYKKQKDIVQIIPYCNEEIAKKYGKIFLRKEKVDKNYPEWLIKMPHVSCGGKGFTNGNYRMLENNIDFVKPDMTLHLDLFRKLVLFNEISRDRVVRLMNSSFVRITEGNEIIITNYKKHIDAMKKNIIFYDTDIFSYEEWPIIMEDFVDYNWMYNPHIINDEEDLNRLITFERITGRKPHRGENKMILNPSNFSKQKLVKIIAPWLKEGGASYFMLAEKNVKPEDFVRNLDKYFLIYNKDFPIKLYVENNDKNIFNEIAKNCSNYFLNYNKTKDIKLIDFIRQRKNGENKVAAIEKDIYKINPQAKKIFNSTITKLKTEVWKNVTD